MGVTWRVFVNHWLTGQFTKACEIQAGIKVSLAEQILKLSMPKMA